MSMISARGRKAIEKLERKNADTKIVKGLKEKGYSISEIARMMGAPESQVLHIVRMDEQWSKLSSKI